MHLIRKSVENLYGERMETTERQVKKSFAIVSLIILLIMDICGTAEAKLAYATTNDDASTSGPYGIRAGQPWYSNITNSDVGVIYTAGTREASTSLAYSSYIFTINDIIFFSYTNGTQVELYDSAGNPVPVVPNVLDKGEHAYVNTSQGVYMVAGSNKFAVLTGDASTSGTSGYYAMDANGRGVSREFYSYVPRVDSYCEFIVFAYENNTSVTIQEEVSNGVYTDIASFTLDNGEHWANSVLSTKYLHIIANKPVSALTYYDQSYFVPSSNGGWSGTKFYTYLGRIGYWPEDLTVIAYNNSTSVSIRDSNTLEVIWEGILDSNQAHVESYPSGTNRYVTIASNKNVTVDVQPWVAMTSGYLQGVFIPDKNGTGVGTELIGPTMNGGYLYILAHTDDTHINLYNSQTGAWQASYTLNKGEIVNANPGNGLWKIISDEGVSAYSGWGNYAIAEFAPLSFSVPPCYISLGKADDVGPGNCIRPRDEINYRIDYGYPTEPNCPDINGVITDYLPVEVNYVSSDPCGSYDSDFHTVTWDINRLKPNESGFVTLTVLVNEDAEPNGTIVNYCETESDLDPSSATAVTNVCCFGSDIIYVNADANGRNDGKSWQDAYTELQSALNRARFCGANEIWVATGTYKPTTNPGGYDATFQMVNGTALYGGFAGTETSRSQRNWHTSETILTGDINGDGIGDIHYVVTASGVNETTIIDGFKITKGTSAGIYCYNAASPTIQNNKITNNQHGIYCRGRYSERSDPNITNCIVEDNTYSGIYCSDYASPTISNCIITGNRSGSAGGGMYTEYSYSSGPIVTNCIFAANTASTSGGGIYNNSSSPIVVNCIFAANTTTYYGGGIYGNLRVINCTFTKNRAGWDGGGICKTGNSSVSNCIFWGNYAGRNGNQIYPDNDPNFSYCDIQGGSTGTGNINADPCFVDPNGPDGITGTEDDNLRLLGSSPCIDAGDNAAVPIGVIIDLDDRDRFADGDCNTTVIVDMGAYEFTYAYFGDFDSDCYVDFYDYAILAASWLQNDPLTDIAPTPAGDGIVDTSDLAILCDKWLSGK